MEVYNPQLADEETEAPRVKEHAPLHTAGRVELGLDPRKLGSRVPAFALKDLMLIFVFTDVKFTSRKMRRFKVYDSVALNTLRVLCNCHFYVIPRHFHHPKRNLYPLSGHSPSSPASAPGHHLAATSLPSPSPVQHPVPFLEHLTLLSESLVLHTKQLELEFLKGQGWVLLTSTSPAVSCEHQTYLLK